MSCLTPLVRPANHVKRIFTLFPFPQLGDAVQWLLFFLPWCAFVVSAHFVLSNRYGLFGFAEGSLMCILALPFWRACCARPVFHPLSLLLLRRDRKKALPPFENNERLPWVTEFQNELAHIQSELSAFVAEHAGDKLCDSVTSTATKNTQSTSTNTRGQEGTGGVTRGDVAGVPGSVEFEASKTKTTAPRRLRRPATALLANGFEVFPLCDGSLRLRNAAAARHFGTTTSAVARANGWNAKLWVLRAGVTGADVAVARTGAGMRDDDTGTTTSTRPSRHYLPYRYHRGTSDGTWRVHVVLDADEEVCSDGEYFNTTGSTSTDALDINTSPLRRVAGLCVGGEVRGTGIGDVVVVNEVYRRRWFHRGGGGYEKQPYESEGTTTQDLSLKKEAAKTSLIKRTGAAIVLTFDVLRPEHKHCAVSVVAHKARLTREGTAGDTHELEDFTPRSLAIAVLGNLG